MREEAYIIHGIVIKALCQRLLEEQKCRLGIHGYEFCDEYRKRISGHVVDRMFRFGVDLHKCMEQDQRFGTYYKGIVQALLNTTDGHLLRK